MRFLFFFLGLLTLTVDGYAQTESLARPCADSSFYNTDAGFWFDAAWEEPGSDACDTEETLLFSEVSAVRSPVRDRNRASFSLARNTYGEAHSVVRQESQNGAWSQRLEMRQDTLTRRRFGWRGDGWKLVAGDLNDPELPMWPEGFPRRTLPDGWHRAQQPLQAGYGLSSPFPQGIAAGVLQPHWKAWATRAWNPVETGEEPPWSPVWNLHHVSTGISFSLPWTFTAQFSDTRITKAEIDSVAEQMVAMSVTSPHEKWTLTGALSKSEKTSEEELGWALATTWHHRFAPTSSLEITVRQRAVGWKSAWDPAVSAGTAKATEDDSEDARGAGEFRLAGHLPLARTGLYLETWRVWNPPLGTAREGIRGSVTWSGEGARVSLTGTHRHTRAASGSGSLYRYLEAETRLEGNPHFGFSAFRAWNGSGPTRSGLFFGMEPAWGALRASSGLKVESTADDDLIARSSLGARWAFGRDWNLDANAAAPCYPRWDPEETRWRVTINYAAR